VIGTMPSRLRDTTLSRRVWTISLAGAAVVASLGLHAGAVDAKPASQDRDKDGLSDRYELARSHTNPRKRDTDGDGLSDSYEVKRSHTNPRKRDTDGDGLSDSYEVKRSHTDPRTAGGDLAIARRHRPSPPPVDTVAPNTSITAGPAGTVTAGDAAFRFASSESGSSFQCRLDTGTWANCSSPRSYTGLANGTHSFGVRAKDAAGNVDVTPATRTWIVDPSALPAAPTARFIQSPASPMTGREATFDASGSTCPLTPCTYTWEDDGPDGASGTQWPLGAGQTLHYTFANVGDKSVRLTVSDASARTDTAVKTVTVSAATAPPVVTPAPPPVTPPPPPPVTPPPSPSAACTRTATSAATLSTQFSAAQAGDAICVATADYGTFKAGQKSGMVAIRAIDGATASMALDFSGGAANVTLEGLTIKDLYFTKSVHDVTVRNSRFTGFALIDAAGMRNASILFDSNTHIDINMPNQQTPPGRVHVESDDINPGQPSGIVVRNSLFKGGTADGIRVDGGASIIIEGNEFTGIRDLDPYHADDIQFYGGMNVTIRGNYFHDPVEAASCSLGQHDGGGGNLIERNVIVGGSCYYAMYLRDDNSSIVRHNVFAFGSCLASIVCGSIVIDGKDHAGHGTLFRDNIFTGLSNSGGFQSTFSADHNLTREAVPGSANAVGAPTYVGGANPTTSAGFQLAPGSRGKGAASDGTDIGI